MKNTKINDDLVNLQNKIKNKIEELNQVYTTYHNWEQGEKIMINSFYGGFGNQYMYFYDPIIASCITKQGKHAILYAEKHINDYFQKYWYNDKETHKKLGVIVSKPVIGQATVYIDTDSVYSQLDEVISTTDWKIGEDETNWGVSLTKEDGTHYETRFCGSRTEDEVKSFFEEEFPNCRDLQMFRVKAEAKDFALRLDEVFLSKYFKLIFDKYANDINATDNYLNFELETYSDSGIWLAKKKYIQNLRWTDSMPRHDILDNFSKIKSKGVELIQPSSPNFARKKLNYLVKWIFNNPEFDINELGIELKNIRDEMKVTNIDDICWNKKATKYSEFVLEDNKSLVMAKGTPITTKGIAYYNYLLNNSKLSNKYSKLVSGSKCKYYYCKSKVCEMFAYEPSRYPIELNPPSVDYKTMFDKTILSPINRIIEAIGYKPFGPDLIYIQSLF